jgi:hypothetical protein
VNIAEIRQVINHGLSFLQHSPAERKGYFAVPDDHIVNSGQAGISFAADEGYFQIVLAEMFLKERREYWKGFVPFVLLVCDFSYNGEQKTVPVFLGKDRLKELEEAGDGYHIESRNSILLGPTPYEGGALGILIALFRTSNNDYSTPILDIIGDIGTVFPTTELTKYLGILRPLRRGIDSLLGIKDVQFLLGIRDVFSDANNSKSSFMVLANYPDSQLTASELWVIDNQLLVGPRDHAKRVVDFDYCLLKLDFTPERNFSSLPCSKLWTEIRGMVWDGHLDKAQATFLNMCRDLAISPDVTRPHRFKLISVYKMNLDSEIELFRKTSGPLTESQRGNRKYPSGRAGIEQIRELSSDALRPTMRKMISKWKDIPYMENRPRNLDLDDTVLLQQMSALPALPQDLREGQEDYPSKLADVIATATLNTSLAA